MNIARLLVVSAAVSSFAALPVVAQSVNASAQHSASASAGGTNVNQSGGAGASASRSNAQAGGEEAGALSTHSRRGSADAHGSAAGDAQMRPVKGELQSKLDSKSARVGEPVVLRTTEKTRTADGVVIPKGTRLFGHVTEVEAHAKGHAQSSLGLAFDRAELKNGQSFAIHSVIESVGPSAAQLEAQSMENEDAFAGPAGGGMAAGGGAIAGGGAGLGRAGGGLVGGGAGVVGGATSSVGGVGSGIASNAGGALNAGGGAIDATGNLAGNAAANAGRGVNGSAGAVGALGAHATAIPGVMLDGNAAGGASGMFTAARQNIHFESGTQMILGVAAAK
ncbi:MAG TPA: hypothetical protein VGR47_22055 [Terracidiphilus sp.]|nr:hypothetical protein [Terracidiphilus sp.]